MIFGLKPELTSGLGSCLIVLGDTIGAENAFKLTIGYDPHNITALINLGFLCLQTQRYNEAFEYSKKACSADPNNADAWACQSLAANHLNDKFASTAAFKRAYRLNPSHPLLAEIQRSV
jgi:tetratricopeptide (TPR) repeat protein